MYTKWWCTVIELLFVLTYCKISSDYIGEEIQTNKVLLLRRIASTPFVPNKDFLLPPAAVSSPDDILKSTPMDAMTMSIGDFVLVLLSLKALYVGIKNRIF